MNQGNLVVLSLHIPCHTPITGHKYIFNGKHLISNTTQEVPRLSRKKEKRKRKKTFTFTKTELLNG